MKLLIYISYKNHFELYNSFYDSIAGNNCQIELVTKDQIMLADDMLLFNAKATSYTSNLDKYMQVTLLMTST